MAIYFLDTSAIVKRYIAEPGQAWVLSLCDPAQQHDLYISQITLVDLLPHAGICRGLFLSKELVQGRVAVEVKIESIKVIGCRWKLVAGKQAGIIRVVGKKVRKLGDVIPARYSSCGWRCLSLGQQGTKERIEGIVLDIELDADLLEVALDDGFNIAALVAAGD
jgi:hypothetical protein